MIGFGATNPFPFTLGGGPSDVEDAHEALLDALAPGWDVTEDSAKYHELYALALAASLLWAASKRGANQGQPTKMLEVLTTWEAATGLRPTRAERDIERRSRLAAKLRAMANSTLQDIESAVRQLLGLAFGGIHLTDPAQEITYWPGKYPGPPGREWSTNRLAIRIRVNRTDESDTELSAMLGRLNALLDNMVPAWLTFSFYVNQGFILNNSQIGFDAL